MVISRHITRKTDTRWNTGITIFFPRGMKRPTVLLNLKCDHFKKAGRQNMVPKTGQELKNMCVIKETNMWEKLLLEIVKTTGIDNDDSVK